MQNQHTNPLPAVTEDQRVLIDRFITAFNKIDKFLRKQVNKADRNIPFSQVLSDVKASGKIRVNVDYLRTMSDLRNVLTHEQSGVNTYLSVPIPSIVERLEKILDELRNPPKIFPTYKRQVKILNINDPLSEALSAINELNYSQFPIYDGKSYIGLLTENGITRWLAHHTVTELSLIEFSEIPISHVIKREEKRKNNQSLPYDATIYEAEMLFTKNPVLEAILITHSGSLQETLLGIITRWDVLHLGR